jgi:lipopolysaccharide transport system permease protein
MTTYPGTLGKCHDVWLSLGDYLGTIWKCRYFWLSLVKVDLRARYRGSVLGIGWSLVHPIAMTLIMATIFCKILGLDPHFYVPFLMAGLTCWQFIITTALMGSNSFFQAESYIRQHPAPMAIYPLRTMLGNGFHYLLGLMLVLIFAWGLRGFDTWLPLLALIPTILLMGLLCWAMAIIFGLVTVRFRDTSHLSDLAFQALFYVSPIIYEPSLLHQRKLGFLLHINPIVPFLSLLREPILYSRFPTPGTFLWASSVVVVLGIVASLLLWHEERTLVFHL